MYNHNKYLSHDKVRAILPITMAEFRNSYKTQDRAQSKNSNHIDSIAKYGNSNQTYDRVLD